MRITIQVFLIFFFCTVGNTGFVFSQNSDAPIIKNQNQEPVQYCSDPVAVASLISIENIHAIENNDGIKISISNYIKGEDVLVYDAIDSFQYNWSQDNGYLEITGIGTDADYEIAVSKVYYQNLSSAPTVGIRSLSISLRGADYLPDTEHFYRFIEGNWLSWTTARDMASKMNYYGLQGYLATIRSQEEQDFIMTKTRGTGWIGASDNEREGASEGTWMWVVGPDSGVVFWSGNWGGNSVNNEYSHWRSGDPNNQNSEDFAHMMYSVNKGYWNDLANVGSSIPGYTPQGFLIEFGGMPDDPEVKLSAVAYVEIRKSEHPVLDMDIVKTLICSSDLTNNFNLAFTTGEPETKLTSLDSGVIVNEQTTYSPSITVPGYGVYSFQLEMIDEATCSYIDTISIEFHNQPEALFNLDEDECYGYNLQLAFTGNIEEEAMFTWYYNEDEVLSGMGLDSVNIQLGFDEIERKVGLKVNEQGCMDFISQSVKVRPDIAVTTENSEGCSPLTVSFQSTTNELNHTFSWNFADNTGSEEKNPSHTFINQTDNVLYFDVQLTVYSNDGCDSTSVFEDLVKVYPVPTARFDFEPQDVPISEPEVIFNNAGNAGTSYIWDFGDSTAVSDIKNPVHRYDEMGVYSIHLEAYNDFGCVDTISRQVKVTFDKLFPPNAFSPNAPSEEDREFRLYGDGVGDKEYQLLIFNRWGEVIFESNSQHKGWDGKMKNSDFAPAGVYTWVLQYLDILGEWRKQQGNVTLLF